MNHSIRKISLSIVLFIFTLSLIAQENDTTSSDTIFSKLEIQEAAEKYVLQETGYRIYHSSITNLFIKDNTIHIYIDENGNFIKTSIPTTAKENHLYQIHVLVEKNNLKKFNYKFSYEGKYQPKFNVNKNEDDIAPSLEKPNESAESAEPAEPIIVDIKFAKIGPFTEEFSIKLVNKLNDDILIDHKITVAKLYHVTISTGLLATSLSNPQNIEKMSLGNGDTTLVADDPFARGALTIMATYYPLGRSFLFTPSGNLFDPSRFGIQVGAQLNDKLSENFFVGLSHDFARGGSFSYGAHFGRRNTVAGTGKSFDFGTELYTLQEVTVKKEWQVGFYFGVVIDTRIAIELFKNLANGG